MSVTTHWRLNDDFDVNQRRRRLTQTIYIGVRNCVRVCNNYLKIYKKNLIGELGGINTIVSQHAIRLRFNFTGFTKTTHQMPTCHHHNERLMS